MPDNAPVDCAECRESLSARLDGEDEPAPAERTDDHLAGCTACQAWWHDVADLNRALRVRPAVPVPDLTAAVLEQAPVHGPPQGWWVRGALTAVAAAQVGLALSQMFGVGAIHGGVPAATHLFNESTAWNLALGMGMLWVAFRPHAARGLLPALGAFVVVLFVYSVYDLVTGAAPAHRVAGHGLLLAGLALMIVVHRGAGTPSPGTATDTGAADGTPSPRAAPRHDAA